jgi:hypothetical protein
LRLSSSLNPSLFYFSRCAYLIDGTQCFKTDMIKIQRSETPPNTPQRARIAAQRSERDNRMMDSPEHHRAPHAMRSPGHIAPINLGLPVHAPNLAPGNNPFLAPPAPLPAPVTAPVFAPAPAPALGPAPALAPAVYNGQQYNHLPAALAQLLAGIPPMPQENNRGRGCGRGRGRGQGYGYGQAHPPAMVC